MHQCECGKNFHNNSAIWVHRKKCSEHRRLVFSYACVCLEKFNSIDHILNHQKNCSIHKKDLFLKIKIRKANNETYDCICEQKFKSIRGKNGLRLHRKECFVWKESEKLRHQARAKKQYADALKKDPTGLAKRHKDAGIKISQSILNNPSEIERRAKLLGNLNKTKQFRRKSSETAIKTSSRPDIKSKRSGVLKKWREENPEEFKKCTNKMLSTWKSIPESILYGWCKEIDNNFKENQFLVRSVFRNKNHRKQLDIFNIEKNIIIEFDGLVHFKPIYGLSRFEIVKYSDNALNSFKNEFCIIRIGYDCFSYSRGGYFKPEILKLIKNIVLYPQNGLYLFGECYGKN